MYVIILIKANTICAAVQVKKLSKAGKGTESAVVHVMSLLQADIGRDMVITVLTIDASVITVGYLFLFKSKTAVFIIFLIFFTSIFIFLFVKADK